MTSQAGGCVGCPSGILGPRMSRWMSFWNSWAMDRIILRGLCHPCPSGFLLPMKLFSHGWHQSEDYSIVHVPLELLMMASPRGGPCHSSPSGIPAVQRKAFCLYHGLHHSKGVSTMQSLWNSFCPKGGITQRLPLPPLFD